MGEKKKGCSFGLVVNEEELGGAGEGSPKSLS